VIDFPIKSIGTGQAVCIVATSGAACIASVTEIISFVVTVSTLRAEAVLIYLKTAIT